MYRRLIPRKWNTAEGKRHVKTVPVKLAKATTDGRSPHRDWKFGRASFDFLYELASYLGPENCFFFSPDDKVIFSKNLENTIPVEKDLKHLEIYCH